MDSVFKISKYGTTGIQIDGLEQDGNEYLAEASPVLPSKRNYAYSQSVTLNALYKSDSLGVKTYVDSDFVDHTTSSVDTDSFTLSIDGLYTVSHIILPTKVWLDSVVAQDPTYLAATYNYVYYYNLGNIYLYDTTTLVSTVITVIDFMTKDATAPALSTDKTTTIIRTDKDTFIMYFISTDLAMICEDLLTSAPRISRSDIIIMKQNNRDVLWMFINTMNYCTGAGNLYEAQRYMEQYITSRNIITSSFYNGPNY
jgi:hypothetical protein